MNTLFETIPVVKEGIVLVTEWMNTNRQEFEENDDFKELVRVVNEIEVDQDYSQEAYEDIINLELGGKRFNGNMTKFH